MAASEVVVTRAGLSHPRRERADPAAAQGKRYDNSSGRVAVSPALDYTLSHGFYLRTRSATCKPRTCKTGRCRQCWPPL